MGLLDYFRGPGRNKGSASVAKERLQILVAHDRAARDRPSYLPKLQQEILGEPGRHARAAVGVNALPLNAPVEIEFAFEVK